MMLKNELLNSGAIITTKETNYGQYRKEIEVWFKKDSEPLRAFVGRLISQYPELDMSCNIRPHPMPHKNMASGWSSASNGPYISISLDIEDVAEYGTRWRMPLKTLLADIQGQGPKDSMAFRIKMNCEIWQELIEPAESETQPSI